MAAETLEERMVRMEERMERQRGDIDTVTRRQDQQHLDMKSIAMKLDGINLTINKLLWVMLGGVGFFVLQQVGLLEFIKKILAL